TGRRRPIVLGLLLALILATRVTAALVGLWCIAEVLRAGDTRSRTLRSLVSMGLPCLVAAALLLLYNYARFGDAFDQGYAEQLVPPFAAATRAQGIFSVRHVPGNLYYMLLASPTPVRPDDGSTDL